MRNARTGRRNKASGVCLRFVSEQSHRKGKSFKPFSVLALCGIGLAAVTARAIAAPPTDNWYSEERSGSDSGSDEEQTERPYRLVRVLNDAMSWHWAWIAMRGAEDMTAGGQVVELDRRAFKWNREGFAEGTLRRSNRLDANCDGAIAENGIAGARRHRAR